MKKIVVLGCGLVGRVIAEDLSTNFDVTSVDFSQKNLDKISVKKINKKCLDLQDPNQIKNVVKDFDLVVMGASNDWRQEEHLSGSIPDKIASGLECSTLMARSASTAETKLSKVFWEQMILRQLQ